MGFVIVRSKSRRRTEFSGGLVNEVGPDDKDSNASTYSAPKLGQDSSASTYTAPKLLDEDFSNVQWNMETGAGQSEDVFDDDILYQHSFKPHISAVASHILMYIFTFFLFHFIFFSIFFSVSFYFLFHFIFCFITFSIIFTREQRFD